MKHCWELFVNGLIEGAAVSLAIALALSLAKELGVWAPIAFAIRAACSG